MYPHFRPDQTCRRGGGLAHDPTFTSTAVYGFADKEVREVNQIDLRPYLGADVPQDPYVRKLKDISEALKTIATYARKVQ